MKTLNLMLFLGIALIVLNFKAYSQTKVEHPAYLHALSDMRAARWLIENRPEKEWKKTVDEVEAVKRIDAAINEIKKASIDDGKNVNDHPPVDEQPKQKDRLRQAIDFLNKAHADINEKEENKVAKEVRENALKNIHEAIQFIEKALEPDHPYYLHALSDLRAARWLIEHRPETTWTQQVEEVDAVKQIDVAIKEIIQAAIDDKKNINDHPPVDEHPKQMDRLKEAVKYLKKANEDVNKEEDNNFAKGLRNNSLKHIAEAIKLVEKVIAANEKK